MISIPAAYTDTHRISMPSETVPAVAVADASKQDAAPTNFPQAALAEKEAIILLDTLRRAKAATQHFAFPITGKDAAPVRDNLKILIGLAENQLTGSGPALKAAGIMGVTGFTAPSASKPIEPAQDLPQSTSASLGAIGDRLAAAGQHKEAVMLYMAADMNLAEQTDMRYVVSSGKSLLALGQVEEAEEAFLLAGSMHPLNGGNQFVAVDEPIFDIDYLLSELGKLQHETSQTRVTSQQGAIQRNRDSREAQIKQKLEAMEANSKAKAEHDAAAKKAGFWSKLSMALGVATAVLGIMLAPFTGGLSLLGTALLVTDLALELGEHFTGIEMSFQTNLQKVCALVVNEIFKGVGSPKARELCAAVLALLINIVLMVVFAKMSVTGSIKSIVQEASKGSKAVSEGSKVVSKGSKAVSEVSQEGSEVNKTISKGKQVKDYLLKTGGKRMMQLTTFSGALTSIYGGGCAYDAAVAGFELNASDVQQTDIEKRQVKLDKLFEQLSDDLKLVAKELQRDMELLAEVLSGNIESRQKTITTLFHRPNLAA